MDTRELQTTKYLKKEDFPQPKIVTIKTVTKENVALPDQPRKERGIIYFNEYAKGMVLNKTNLMRVSKVCGSTETEDWTGKQVVIYVDEEVEFGGEQVGGLRLRAPKVEARAKGNFSDMKDDIPFNSIGKGISGHAI